MPRIVVGNDSVFNAIALGEMHPSTQQFLQTQMQTMSNNLNEQGARFMNNAYALFNNIEQSRSVRVLQAAQRALGNLWNKDEIRYLSKIGEMQWAPRKMQKYIMAEPEIRQSFHDQTLEGYSGTYKDAYPDDIGENHYHFRQVTNGLLFDLWEKDKNMDTEEPEWTATTYYDDLEPGDRELDILEQVDVVHSWESIKAKISEGQDDPTSRFNASL